MKRRDFVKTFLAATVVTGKTPAERALMEKSIRNFAEVNKGGGDIAPFQFTGTSAIWSLLGEGDKALSDLHRFMRSPINCPNSMNHYGGRNPCLETPVYVEPLPAQEEKCNRYGLDK